MSNPRLTPLAQSLPASVPFVGPEAQERAQNKPFAARLGANENVFGPSPKAIRALQYAAGDTWMYGDPESHDLRQALSRHHTISPENIMIGEGIDALLGYLVRLMIAPGDRVVTSRGAYPTFNYHVSGYGGNLETVPYKGDHEDPIALLEAARQCNAKMVYLANPDNPMGSWHGEGTIRNMIDHLPVGCLLVLDEAYVEFAPQNDVFSITTIPENVVRMRTFSKAYGMAGARVGYAIGAPELIDAFHKVRNHFGMARISQAGAMAALGDQPYLQEVLVKVAKARTAIAAIARQNRLTPLPSSANFVAIDCGKDGAFARTVLHRLAELGVFARMPLVPPQDRCIRVSAGTDKELDILADTLPKALALARNRNP